MSRDILARENRKLVEEYATANVLLAFDYDGTLAPIVDRPEDAWMRERTRQLMGEVSRRYPCIVISGREQTDAMRRLRGIGLFAVIGNHGLEPWRRKEAYSDQVACWLAQLHPELGRLPGVSVEDKVFSIAIHYRQSPNKQRARRAILRCLSSLEGVRVLGGKAVYNVLPKGAPDKGAALRVARDWLHCDAVIYVGDDDTDEDVFRLDEPWLLSIRVGASATSRAGFFLGGQDQMDDLLESLLLLRDRGDGTRSARRADEALEH